MEERYWKVVGASTSDMAIRASQMAQIRLEKDGIYSLWSHRQRLAAGEIKDGKDQQGNVQDEVNDEGIGKLDA